MVKYRKKEYNLLTITLNLIERCFLPLNKIDAIDVKPCTDRLHWLQKLDYKTHCKVCGKALHD